MNEITKSLKHLACYTVLLALNIPFCGEIVPEIFPLKNLSSVYLMILGICLILRIYYKVAGRTKLKKAMLCLSCSMFALVFLRCVKYSVFGPVYASGRYVWYLYYVPIMLIPMFLFYSSLFVFEKDETAALKRSCWIAAVTAALILLVLTNDLHQWVFRFKPGFENWDRDYSRGWGFIAVTIWEYALYLGSVVNLIVKCSVAKIRRYTPVILLPFAVGVVLLLLSMTDSMPKIRGVELMQFPEVVCFMVAGAVECCMQLGLIPTNESYAKLMRVTSAPVMITDFSGKTVYRSQTAKPLTEEAFRSPNDARIGEHTVLKRVGIPGGYGFWQNDVTELDRLNEELEAAREALSEETELIRLRELTREKKLRLEQRSAVYDAIADRTQSRSRDISRAAEEALDSRDTAARDQSRRHIVLLGAYIKRYANLMLLSSECNAVSTGELGLSVAEVLRYLILCGIPGEMIHNTVGCMIPADLALSVFEAFDTLIEENLPELAGVYVNLSEREGEIVFKLTLENMRTDDPRHITQSLASRGVRVTFEEEDRTGFFSFAIPKEGRRDT